MRLPDRLGEISEAARLVAELEGLDVELWEEGEMLRFRAPKGVMTEARHTGLRMLKPEILEHLRTQLGATMTAHPEARFEPFPLTQVQEAYLLGRGGAFPYGGVGCHAYGEIVMDTIDMHRLQHAWDRIVARHDMLRAVIEADGFQHVLPEPPAYEIAVADVVAAQPAEAAAHIESTRRALDHRVYQPGDWPLFDIKVTRAPDRAVLHFSIDFLIADYVSITLLLSELGALYATPDAALPPLSVTFRDYQLAEKQMLAKSRRERDRQYWWQRIGDLPPAPELPLKERGGEAQSVENCADRKPRFRRHATMLPQTEWERLKAAAAAYGLTSSAALLAAYAEVIARWSGQPRFTLNVTLLQRFPLHPEVDRIVGDFTSINLLAIEPEPNSTFAARAKAVQARLFEDLDHRLYTGIDIMREIARRRGTEGALMPVIFTSAVGLANSSGLAAGFGEIAYGISQTPQAWIDCQAMERDGCLRITWDVRLGVFPEGVVEAMFAAFGMLVRDLGGPGAAWDAAAPVALPPDQARQRASVNNTAAPQRDTLLHQGFLRQANAFPHRPAIISDKGALAYDALLSRAEALAARLAAVDEGRDRIAAIVMETGPEQAVAALGALVSGWAYLPVDLRSPANRRRRMLEDAGARVALMTRGSVAEGLPEGLVRLDIDLASPLAPEPSASRDGHPGGLGVVSAGPDGLAYVIFTSGSTGAPNGVMITHRAAANTVEDINERFRVGPADRILGLSTLAFDLSVYDIFGALAAGATLVLPEHRRRDDPSHWAELMQAHAVTVWNSVPAKMEMLLDHFDLGGNAPVAPPRLVLMSGDTVSPALVTRLRARWPDAVLVSLGGATEASIWSISHLIEKIDRVRIPYGSPLRNQSVDVRDWAMRPRPDWVIGDLYIGGAGLAAGYIGKEALTAERFVADPQTGERLYRTGDLGRYRPDGEIDFLGRNDSQIKLRGHRIELGEIETVLREHPAVANAAVLLSGEGTEGRSLAAFVEPHSRKCEAGEADRICLALAVTAQKAAEILRAGADCERVVRFAAELDRTALLAMLVALKSSGLFSDATARHPLADILEQARVLPRHHRLVRRWLGALLENGLVKRDADDAYRAAALVDETALSEAWRRTREIQPLGDDRAELMDYFRLAARRLPELLRGEIDPVRLLFPEGKVDIHEVAYNDNFLSRYLNRLVSATIVGIARSRGTGRLDVLEIGAGVGGTSVEVIPALQGLDANYLFTDVSQFFLNNAAERFEAYPWVRTGLYDLNRDYRAQGLSANSFDVVLCANVLHYAIDARQTLQRICELLKPGGFLVFIELVRDNYQILTSMEFLFDETVTEFADVRKGRDATFIGLSEWHKLIAEAGGEAAFSLPRADDILAKVGFHVFCARFKGGRERVSVADLARHLGESLPAYMAPSEIEVIDRLPLTENGKIDRKALAAMLIGRATRPPAATGQAPASDLERRLAETWAKVLKLPRVARDQNFFALGGDSLLAAQLVARMRESIPEANALLFDAVLRMMLDGPTIAEVAAAIPPRDQPSGGEETKVGSPFVWLSPPAQQGSPHEAPATILIHDATGSLACYDRLVAAARSDGAAEGGPDGIRRGGIGGLLLRDSESYLKLPPEVLVARVAADYVDALGSHGAHADGRRRHLVGYEMGGMFALEIARILQERGEAIRLTLVDATPPRFLIEDELLAEYLLTRHLGVDPMRLGFPAEAAIARGLAEILAEAGDCVPEGSLRALGGDAELGGLAWCFRRLGERSREERASMLSKNLANAGAGAALLERVPSLAAIFMQSLTAATAHEIQPFAGDMTFLRTRAAPPLWLSEEPEAFWRARCLGRLSLVEPDVGIFFRLSLAEAAETLRLLEESRSSGAADG